MLDFNTLKLHNNQSIYFTFMEPKKQTGDPISEAETYLRDHKIIELIEDLNTILCYRQPDNVEEFLI